MSIVQSRSLDILDIQDRPCPSVRGAWMAVGILSGLAILSQLDRTLISLLVPEIKADFSLSEVQIGTLIGAAYALFYAVGALPIGWALDRFDRRKVIWAGVTLWSLGTVGCGLARGYAALFLSRCIVGGGEASLMPAANSLLPDLFSRRRLGIATSVYSMAVKVGIGTALMLGGGLAALFVPDAVYTLPVIGMVKGWKLIFLCSGIPGIFLAFLVFAIPDVRKMDAGRKRENTNYFDYLRFIWKNPRFMISHQVAVLPLTMTSIGLSAWMPTFYMRMHHMPAQEVGIWLGLAISIGPVIALPFHGSITDRLFQRGMHDAHLRYLIVMIVLAIPCVIASLEVRSIPLSFVLLGMFFACTCCYVSLPAVVLQLAVPANLRGKVFSVSLAITGVLAVGTGPVIIAAVTDRLGGPHMIAQSLATCASVLLPLSAICYAFALRPLRSLLEVVCAAPGSNF